MSKSLSFIGWIQCHIDYANSLCECLRHTLLKLEGKYLRRQAWILKPRTCSYIPALVNYKLLRNQIPFSVYKVQLVQDVLSIVLLHSTGTLVACELALFIWKLLFPKENKFFKLKKKVIKNNKTAVLNTSPSSHNLITTPIFHFEKERKVRELGE